MKSGLQGQIVEIPATSHFYTKMPGDFVSKRAELEYYSKPPDYGLFDGILVGAHYGMDGYKVGQRKGLKLSGMDHPLYVIKIDSQNNRLFVGAGANHPGLFQKVFFFEKKSIIWKKNIDPKALSVFSGETSLYGKKRGVTGYYYDDGLFLEFENALRLPVHFELLKIYINQEELLDIKSD